MASAAREEDTTPAEAAPLVWPIGLVLVGGAALPIEVGLAAPLAAIAFAAWVASRQESRLALWRTAGGSVAALPAAARAPLAAILVVVAAVVAAIAARTVSAVFVAFPAAVMAVGAALAITLAGSRLGRIGRLVAIGGALAIVPSTLRLGVEVEAAGVDARGEAHSGPILGIHPFQTTAIVIDGYGPFDLPVNDYVEPDGWRGYGPQALAEALERDLRRIAEVHFADGPARAREAFAGAEVEAIELPAIRERLDREPEGSAAPRLRFTSGSTGQRSRVEVVCPGTRSDPRGLQPDRVTERMCPDRYAAAGSAGPGLTGRWSGYSEARGNERVGIGRLLGWTRSDDREGARGVRAEQRIGALVVLGFVVLLALGRRGAAVASLRALGGAGAALGLVAGAILAFGVLVPVRPAVGAVEAAPAGFDVLSLAGWTGLLALAWASAPGPSTAIRRRPAAPLAALLLAVATLGAATDLRISGWLRPDLWDHVSPGVGAGSRTVAWERWVIEAGDRLQGATGITLSMAEGLVAVVLVLVALGLVAVALRELPRAACGLLPGLRATWAPPLASAGIAAGLVLSQQTQGGALLLAPALALVWVVAVTLAIAASAGRARLGWGALWAAAMGMVLLGVDGAWSAVPRVGPVLAASSALFVALGASTLAVLRQPRAPGSPG